MLHFDEPDPDPGRTLRHDEAVHVPVETIEASVSVAGSVPRESCHSLFGDHAKVGVQYGSCFQLLQLHLNMYHGRRRWLLSSP